MTPKTKLIVGVSLPLIIILIVAVLSIAPRIFFHPKYDFIYTVDISCDQYYSYPCSYGGNQWSSYTISDGKISKETDVSKVPQSITPPDAKKEIPKIIYPKLYRYHVATGAFEEISFEDVQKLTLVNGTAPDGTIVINGAENYNEGVFGMMFGGYRSEQNSLYLKNGSASQRIVVQNGDQSGYYYNNNFHLVGWVK